jgi:hypothetical protein
MELTTRPMPNPDIREPTKYSGDRGKKKNPTPIPIITPPPIAQVLLSSFSLDIGKKSRLTLFNTSANAKTAYFRRQTVKFHKRD